ncbi:IS66 Orf2 like protein [Anaerovirgula multivorans]|uniref:IS66 Orf2 like protein n=1 Tax=Anaerovirgula multivorans TaxID=312168 RepID=A0A239CUB9_9FIRM|nr:IS66 family insertion sequence element accessory protein TnpB [Anaerovirgula multivorans]SNS22953.1 IS66 Orf2 like protein [Anaerovirgula multivorans]
MKMSLAGKTLKVNVAAGVTDLRNCSNGLSEIVREHFKMDPTNGQMYVFANRNRDMIKIMWYDIPDQTRHLHTVEAENRFSFSWLDGTKKGTAKITYAELNRLLSKSYHQISQISV